MTSLHSAAPDRFLQTRFASLLRSAARVLGGSLTVWSEQLHVILTAPRSAAGPPDAALSDVVSRAAAHHTTISGRDAAGGELRAVPVRTRGGLAAILAWSQTTNQASRGTPPESPPQAVEVFLEDLARVLGQHLELLRQNHSMVGALADSRSRVDLLHRITERLAHSPDLRGTLEFILEECRRTTGSDAALLSLPGRRWLLLAPRRNSRRRPEWFDETLARRLGEHLRDRVRPRRAEPLVTQAKATAILRAPLSLPMPAQLAYALLPPRGHSAGLLCLVRADARPFGAGEMGLIESLAEQLKLALRAGGFQQNHEAFLLSTVRALVSTIEAKDHYTSGHSTRVHLLSMLLGKELGLTTTELESLKWASLLHDVGKIGLPESILNKPGRLTREEYDIVKQHPQRGYQVLSHIRQLQDASQAVLLHHERYAGGGYPLGIAGEGIPRAARIIAVADTFDALTSRRPYRQPRGEDEALDEIRRVRGSQLDPEVVDSLDRILPFLRENLVIMEAESQPA